jgi:hypothetical protein
MPNTLEIFLLDSGDPKYAVALGRSDGDVAIEKIPLDSECNRFIAYRDKLDGVVLGTTARPSTKELREFGESLFEWLFRGDLRVLYAQVPALGAVSIQVLSTRPALKGIPWEYIQVPDCQPAPHRNRCVVRVLPTCGIRVPPPIKASKKFRVLFVSADPIDQTGVPWADVRDSIEQAIRSQSPAKVSLKVERGMTRTALSKLIAKENFEVFHFLGHGRLNNGEGELVLVDPDTQQSDYITATELAANLSGKGVRLAILSACLSGAGNTADDFSILATSLLRAGIPAVVANQVSIPTKSVASFVGRLYEKLLETGNIDAAVMEGRLQLAIDLKGTTGAEAVIEWGIPSLYRLSAAMQILK